MKAAKSPKSNQNKVNTETGLGRVLPRLDSTSDAPVKLIFLILYILGAVLIWHTQADIAASTEKIEYISPIAEFAARNIFVTYLMIAGIAVTILILTPIGKRSVQDQLKSIGLVNHAEAVPELKSKRKDKKNPKITIHLILATQRPDSTILNGQIKNNINCRICGRADNVLSMIILDKTDAADQIPEDAQGRFLLQDGTMFQAYWFEDSEMDLRSKR